MEDENSSSSKTTLCKTNCGFYAGFDGFCSKCHQDFLRNNQNAEAPRTKSPQPPAAPVPEEKVEEKVEPAPTPAAEASVSSPEAKAAEPSSTRPKACEVCKKRLPMIPFQCDCNGYFCGIHRYSDKHNCSYNYQDAAKKVISSANPQIISSKLNKI